MFKPVKLTKEEWFKAIDRDCDDVELGICCANISVIRDMLYLCRENGGMTGTEIKELQEALDNHEPVVTPAPGLARIFGQLGVVWKPC